MRLDLNVGMSDKTSTTNSTPPRWSKFETTFVLIPQPAGVLKIPKK